VGYLRANFFLTFFPQFFPQIILTRFQIKAEDKSHLNDEQVGGMSANKENRQKKLIYLLDLKPGGKRYEITT